MRFKQIGILIFAAQTLTAVAQDRGRMIDGLTVTLVASTRASLDSIAEGCRDAASPAEQFGCYLNALNREAEVAGPAYQDAYANTDPLSAAIVARQCASFSNFVVTRTTCYRAKYGRLRDLAVSAVQRIHTDGDVQGLLSDLRSSDHFLSRVIEASCGSTPNDTCVRATLERRAAEYAYTANAFKRAEGSMAAWSYLSSRCDAELHRYSRCSQAHPDWDRRLVGGTTMPALRAERKTAVVEALALEMDEETVVAERPHTRTGRSRRGGPSETPWVDLASTSVIERVGRGYGWFDGNGISKTMSRRPRSPGAIEGPRRHSSEEGLSDQTQLIEAIDAALAAEDTASAAEMPQPAPSEAAVPGETAVGEPSGAL